MGKITRLSFLFEILALSIIFGVFAESPYRYYDWEITHGTISPLGVSQRVGCSPHICNDFILISNYKPIQCIVILTKCFSWIAGYSYKWAISRSKNWVQHQRQCLCHSSQQIGWAFPHDMVTKFPCLSPSPSNLIKSFNLNINVQEFECTQF